MHAPRIHVTHVVAGLDPSHGGPSYSVPRLCKALNEQGITPCLFAIAEPAASDYTTGDAGFEVTKFRRDMEWMPILRELRLSFGFSGAIRGAARSSDLIHNHGLWLLPNVQAGWAAARANIPLMVAPRGMLAAEALAFSRAKKLIFWHTVQRAVLKRAACFHATSDQEHDEIRRAGLINPVAVIPNGIDLPVLTKARHSQAHSQEYGRTALFIGRIHPKKGLERLIMAWALASKASDQWNLRIVGPDENSYRSQLSRLAGDLGLKNVSFEDAVYGSDKWDLYQQADVFVLPTMNENFGLTVAESLACETPAICTTGAPWSGLEMEGCGWWVDPSVESLASTLALSLSSPRSELRMMGARGRAWMARDFTWTAVAKKLASVYAWLITGSDRPPFVRTIS
jgi:glycosyltransferase involved in cell wall biosynthesis